MAPASPPPSQIVVPPTPAAPPHTPSRREMAQAALPRLMSPGRLTAASNSASASPSPTSNPPSGRPTLSLDVRDTRNDTKRLPSLPLPTLPSPLRGNKPWALGAYDNKLVSSSLSQLPPLPPLSPDGMSSTGSNLSSFSHTSASPHLHSNSTPSFMNSAATLPPVPRLPQSSSSTSAGGVIILPDGTSLSMDGSRSDNPSMLQTMAHSSPNSPWSLLTVHVLPVFAGSPLKTPLEDLNQLCNQHLVSTSQRIPVSRLISVLTSDLREFISSGMLTLRAKFETLEEGKVLSRAAEVWNFFWGQILPYVEGVFLPFAQIRDVPSAASARNARPSVAMPPIPVRHILLSGFLLHILLPLLPRLLPLLADLPAPRPEDKGPVSPDLPRLLQMSLVLSTQARYSSFFPTRSAAESESRDDETRESVEELGRAVRWSMAVVTGSVSPEPEPDPVTDELDGDGDATMTMARPPHNRTNSGDRVPTRPGLKRGPSVSQAGRLRRRGLSGSISQLEPEPGGGMPSALGPLPESRWGRPRIDEDDEGEAVDGSWARRPGPGNISAATSMAPSTVGASTVRGGESFATLTDQRTPQAGYGGGTMHRHGHARGDSSGESDLTNATTSSNATGRRR